MSVEVDPPPDKDPENTVCPVPVSNSLRSYPCAPTTVPQLNVTADTPITWPGVGAVIADTPRPAVPPFTFTVTACDALPEPFVATSVYVVVTPGNTLWLPLAETPLPFSVTLVAPDVVQLSSELCPIRISAGLAVKELTTGAGVTTLTVADPSAPPSCVTAR